jgi:hypothetical protein
MSGPPERTEDASRGEPAASLWQWLAVGLLVLCWIAEASMCADRGL